MDLLLAFFAGMVYWEIGVIAGLVIISLLSLYHESSFWFFASIAVLLFVPWSGGITLWSSLSIAQLLLVSALYIPVGVLWSVFKWKQFVTRIITSHEKSNESQENERYLYTKESVKESIENRKSYDQIGFWILNWPFSMLGYVINDFVSDIARTIVRKLSKMYDGITESLLNSSKLN